MVSLSEQTRAASPAVGGAADELICAPLLITAIAEIGQSALLGVTICRRGGPRRRGGFGGRPVGT